MLYGYKTRLICKPKISYPSLMPKSWKSEQSFVSSWLEGKEAKETFASPKMLIVNPLSIILKGFGWLCTVGIGLRLLIGESITQNQKSLSFELLYELVYYLIILLPNLGITILYTLYVSMLMHRFVPFLYSNQTIWYSVHL